MNRMISFVAIGVLASSLFSMEVDSTDLAKDSSVVSTTLPAQKIVLASPDSGLIIEQIVAGTGEGAENGDLVSVHYTGKFTNGSIFDSSRDRSPLEFVLGGGRVIRGWDLGILGMKVGEKRVLHVSSELGYGNQQVGPIPPNSDLVFTVELLALRKGLSPDSFLNPDSMNWKPLASGVEYVQLQKGKGGSAKNGDQVSVHYTGWLEKGTKFDSSKDRGLALDFILGSSRVIRGFEQSVLGMKTGEVRYVRIQPSVGYAGNASARIPAWSVLIFRIEMIAVHGAPTTLGGQDIFPDLKSQKWVQGKDGLQYAVIQTGEGAPALAGQKVTVQYTGWLTNGKLFDSSRSRGQPFSFPLGAGKVVRGWDIGVEGMLPGEKRYLLIPPQLGYGNRGTGPIPAGATLVFEVELVKSE